MNKSFEIFSDNIKEEKEEIDKNNNNNNQNSNYYNLTFNEDYSDNDLTINSMWDDYEISNIMQEKNEEEKEKEEKLNDLSFISSSTTTTTTTRKRKTMAANNIKLLRKYINHLNNYINIYNLNVSLFKNTLTILDKYFTRIFNETETLINNTHQKLNQFKCHDVYDNNIHRNYEPVVKLFKDFIYIHVIIILIDKIQKIEKYIIDTERTLSKHSWLLIKAIWYIYYFPKFGALPDRNINDDVSNFAIIFEKLRMRIVTIINADMVVKFDV